MHTFFVENETFDTKVTLSPAESNHAAQVLRVKTGSQVRLVNGKGKSAVGSIELVSRKGCVIVVQETVEASTERKGAIHLAVAPTKSIDRFEFFLEKATEIGVDRITPIISKHSERRKLRHDRSLKVIIAAMKQSQRLWLPQLDELILLDDFINQEHAEQRYFGWCEGEHQSLMSAYTPADALVMIGPEGDFSQDEATSLIDKGYKPVSIGNTRLRTETAALSACAWMSLTQAETT